MVYSPFSWDAGDDWQWAALHCLFPPHGLGNFHKPRWWAQGLGVRQQLVWHKLLWWSCWYFCCCGGLHSSSSSPAFTVGHRNGPSRADLAALGVAFLGFLWHGLHQLWQGYFCPVGVSCLWRPLSLQKIWVAPLPARVPVNSSPDNKVGQGLGDASPWPNDAKSWHKWYCDAAGWDGCPGCQTLCPLVAGNGACQSRGVLVVLHSSSPLSHSVACLKYLKGGAHLLGKFLVVHIIRDLCQLLPTRQYLNIPSVPLYPIRGLKGEGSGSSRCGSKSNVWIRPGIIGWQLHLLLLLLCGWPLKPKKLLYGIQNLIMKLLHHCLHTPTSSGQPMQLIDIVLQGLNVLAPGVRTDKPHGSGPYQ